MNIPREFPKWDRTIDGLEDAGRWALDCERSRLPTGIVIPRAGQIWETVRDCEVCFRAHINFPRPKLNQAFGVIKDPGRFEPRDFLAYMMQFGTAILRQSERVRILELGEVKPVAITFVPVRYHELHESIIPAKVRALSTYHGGYQLSVKTARSVSDFQKGACQTYFNEDFHLVEDIP